MAALCVAAAAGFYGYGQAASHPAGDTTRQCDGTVPQRTAKEGSARKLSPAGAANSEAAPEDAGRNGEHLKLSTKAAGGDKTEAQGQFCRRERPAQDALKPSAPAPQPDAAREPAGADPAPPIAQVEDGNLTIQANGQDFSSVVAAVQTATGISVQMPANAAAEPVFMNIGPVPVREALLALMEGSPYNYLLLGSESDPQKIQALILSARPAMDQASQVARAGAAAGPPQVTAYGAEGFRADSEADPEPAPPDQILQPAQIPSSVPAGVNIEQLAAQEGKTTGQVLDELQKRQIEMLDQQAAAAAAQAQSSPQ